jgi:hypothetical protein
MTNIIVEGQKYTPGGSQSAGNICYSQKDDFQVGEKAHRS